MGSVVYKAGKTGTTAKKFRVMRLPSMSVASMPASRAMPSAAKQSASKSVTRTMPTASKSALRTMPAAAISVSRVIPTALAMLTAFAALTAVIYAAPVMTASGAGARAVSVCDAGSLSDAPAYAPALMSDTAGHIYSERLSGEAIVLGTAAVEEEQTDIGGELVSDADGDIEQALPANVRLDRISIDMEVTKPLASARVSSVFGFRKNPVTGKYTFHKGLDLAAPGGTEIHAMYAGRVTLSSWDKGYGNYIIIDHGGFQTLYAHCSRLLRSEGDSVAAGEVIALVGSTGNSTGNHLHVEFRLGGQRYDPEWILGGIYS